MMNPFANKDLSLNSRVRHRMVGDEGVVVCMHSGTVVIVNEVGAFIIEQLKEAQSFNSVACSISDRFEVTEEQAKEDLVTYISELEEQDVLIFQTASSQAPNVAGDHV